MRRAAVARRHHLHAHADVGQHRCCPTEAERLVVGMRCHYDDFGAIRQVKSAAASQRLEPDLCRRSAVGQRPGSEPGSVTHDGPTGAALIVVLLPAGRAARGRVRHGSVGRRSSGQPRAEHAPRPGTGAQARAHGAVRLIVSSTAISTTARTRRADSSAEPLRFNGSASTSAAAALSIASPAASAASTAPRCARVCGSTVSAGTLVQRIRYRARPTQPAGADADRAVPEAWSAQDIRRDVRPRRPAHH